MIDREEKHGELLFDVIPALSQLEENLILSVISDKGIGNIHSHEETGPPILPRKKIAIEITGIPGLGKTHRIMQTVDNLNKLGIESAYVGERHRPHDKGNSPSQKHFDWWKREWFNLSTPILGLINLRRIPENTRVVLIDRFLYNSIVFEEVEASRATNNSSLSNSLRRRNPHLYQIIDNEASKITSGLIVLLPENEIFF